MILKKGVLKSIAEGEKNEMSRNDKTATQDRKTRGEDGRSESAGVNLSEVVPTLSSPPLFYH